MAYIEARMSILKCSYWWMTSVTSRNILIIEKFVTLSVQEELPKTEQNFVEGSFSIRPIILNLSFIVNPLISQKGLWVYLMSFNNHQKKYICGYANRIILALLIDDDWASIRNFNTSMSMSISNPHSQFELPCLLGQNI